MKRGAQVAVAVGAGYLLGRTRKGRLALMLAAASATGKVGGPGALLREGAGKLASSPELGQITETVKGDLLGAARSAAMSAATNRIGSLNERLQGAGSTGTEEAEEAEEAEEQGEEPEAEPETEAEAEPEAEAEAEAEPEGAEDEEQEPEPEEEPEAEEEPEPAPAKRRRAAQSRSSGRARGSAERSPVRRTRR